MRALAALLSVAVIACAVSLSRCGLGRRLLRIARRIAAAQYAIKCLCFRRVLPLMDLWTVETWPLKMLMIRVLSGLPPYGPPALSLSRARTPFRKGLCWNSPPTTERHEWQILQGHAPMVSRLFTRSSVPKAVVIVAGGAGYVVDCEERRLVREINGPIDQCWFNPSCTPSSFRMGWVLVVSTVAEHFGAVLGFRGMAYETSTARA